MGWGVSNAWLVYSSAFFDCHSVDQNCLGKAAHRIMFASPTGEAGSPSEGNWRFFEAHSPPGEGLSLAQQRARKAPPQIPVEKAPPHGFPLKM